MSSTKRPLPPLSEYEINRDQYSDEDLRPFEGQWVAFSLDGKRIVAAAPGLLELDRKLTALGENPEEVGFEFVPGADPDAYAPPELSPYDQNRLNIPDAEWQRYDQQWVALSPEGNRILAGAPDLVILQAKLQAVGVPLADIGVKYVDLRDDFVGGQAEVV